MPGRIARSGGEDQGLDGQLSSDQGSAAGPAGDLERAADLFHALAHAEDAEVARGREVSRSWLETRGRRREFEADAGRAEYSRTATARGDACDRALRIASRATSSRVRLMESGRCTGLRRPPPGLPEYLFRSMPARAKFGERAEQPVFERVVTQIGERLPGFVQRQAEVDARIVQTFEHQVLVGPGGTDRGLDQSRNARRSPARRCRASRARCASAPPGGDCIARAPGAPESEARRPRTAPPSRRPAT